MIATLLLWTGATPGAATSLVSVVARHSSMCLDASSGGPAPRAVVQWTCDGGPLRRWLVTDLGGGYVQVMAANSGLCLEGDMARLDDGAPAVQRNRTGGLHQRWLRADLGNGYLRFIAGHGGKCLKVANASRVPSAPSSTGTMPRRDPPTVEPHVGDAGRPIDRAACPCTATFRTSPMS